MVRRVAAPGARAALAVGWGFAIAAALGVRGWNALAGPRMWGYDAWGHVAYALFLHLYRGVPWADQGWSYFHPPLHYALGWGLASFGSGEVLMRGLPLLSSAGSLATAGLAAWLVRRAFPEQPLLALLGFCAVAFLPTHLFMSAMPGNEMTLTALSSAAVCTFVANECRRRSSAALDVVTGLLLGLALLTKFNAAVTLLAVGASLGLRPFWSDDRLSRCAARAAVIAGLALALSAPYYVRNVVTFGNPFELSRGYALVMSVEGDQPPGARTWRDYVALPPRAFTDPNPLAPHLLRAVWPTVYLNVWADVFRESDVERALALERQKSRSITAMAWLGLFPTSLFVAGGALSVRDVRRGRRLPLSVPVLVLAGGTLASFALFSWQVPIWSALKSSYLLGLSLPYAVFVARALEGLGRAGPAALRVAPAVLLAGVCGVAAAVGTEGVALPRRVDAPATGAVRFYFGEYPEARRVYGRLIAGARYKAAWIDNLAAVDLADGKIARARSLYARAVDTGLPDPLRPGRLAVATALDGDVAAARGILDDAIASRDLPELRANRGAVRAAAGELEGALADLRIATEVGPAMVPAWLNRARVAGALDREEESGRALVRARAEACRAPRGYPYGLGTGEVLEWGVGRRWLLLLSDDGLDLAMPRFYRSACGALRDPS